MNPELKPELRRYTLDGMIELYKINPKYFDELAAKAIHQACIGRTPEKTIKLQQMQWTIEAQLRKSKTLLGRMQMMENIFYNRVFDWNGNLAQIMDNFLKLIRTVYGSEQVPTNKPLLSLAKKNTEYSAG